MLNQMDNITILMSTYNGEQYVAEQIDSILSQTYTNWVLIIRDDGSKDNTVHIIDEYVNREARIKWFDEDESRNLGPMKSFFSMLQKVDSAYYMFSDQDDVWLPQKIEKTLQKMKEIERQSSPSLVHTNLSVTDEQLNVLEEGPASAHDSMQSLLLTNDVTGCTVMINKSLRLLALNDLESVQVMHDMWLGLLAARFGSIAYVEFPTMLYRQHSGNVVGKTTGFLKKARLLASENERRRIQTSINAASALMSLHGSRLSGKEVAYLRTIEGFGTETFVKNLYDMCRNNVQKNSKVATIAFIVKLAINHKYLKQMV